MSLKPSGSLGVFGKACTSLLFLVFLAFGLFFVWFIARDAAMGIQTWQWQKTNCDIISSSVSSTAQEGRVGNFEFEVEYRYTVNGRTLTSNRYKRNPKTFSDYGQAARLSELYRTGSSAVCYVNPSDPSEAVLVRDHPLSFFLLLFPMIFVAIGAGGIYFTWRRPPAVHEEARPISERAAMAKSQRAGVVFFAIFLLIGCGLVYAVLLKPLYKIVVARQWPTIPCVVISSEVKSHNNDDGTTYRVDILYSYEFNGREFKSNRYGFLGGSSSGYTGKQAIVAKHPPGTRTVCYVNPDDPFEAVLQRGFTATLWFGLIPLVFVLMGAGGLFYTLHQRRREALIYAAGTKPMGFGVRFSKTHPAPETDSPDDLVLEPKTPPWAKFLGLLGAGIFWNGIISVFVAQAVNSWRSGHPEWFLLVFMIPFAVIGLALIGGALYAFLALLNPRPRLMIKPGAVPLGGTLRIAWTFTGRAHVLQSLLVRLEGREEATYRRGTTTSTDRSVFADLTIAKVTSPKEIQSGTGSITIPANLMHTFSGTSNKILWAIHFHGKIAYWPDLNEEFPLTILPTAPERPPFYESTENRDVPAAPGF